MFDTLQSLMKLVSDFKTSDKDVTKMYVTNSLKKTPKD